MEHYQVDPHTHYGVPEGKQKVAKGIFEELMTERSPNLMQDINLQIQEVH